MATAAAVPLLCFFFYVFLFFILRFLVCCLLVGSSTTYNNIAVSCSSFDPRKKAVLGPGGTEVDTRLICGILRSAFSVVCSITLTTVVVVGVVAIVVPPAFTTERRLCRRCL